MRIGRIDSANMIQVLLYGDEKTKEYKIAHEWLFKEFKVDVHYFFETHIEIFSEVPDCFREFVRVIALMKHIAFDDKTTFWVDKGTPHEAELFNFKMTRPEPCNGFGKKEYEEGIKWLKTKRQVTFDEALWLDNNVQIPLPLKAEIIKYCKGNLENMCKYRSVDELNRHYAMMAKGEALVKACDVVGAYTYDELIADWEKIERLINQDCLDLACELTPHGMTDFVAPHYESMKSLALGIVRQVRKYGGGC